LIQLQIDAKDVQFIKNVADGIFEKIAVFPENSSQKIKIEVIT